MAATGLFSMSVSLFLFHRYVHSCHILNAYVTDIIWCLPWSFWLTSLSWTISRSRTWALVKNTCPWPHSNLQNHDSEMHLESWFCLLVSLIKIPRLFSSLNVFWKHTRMGLLPRGGSKKKGQGGGEKRIPVTISTLTAIPSQMSSLFYKRRLQLKPDIYLCELFWGPNGRFLNFHWEYNFLDNSK